MSDGTRSGVNWMREKLPPTAVARVCAASVLATPGTPSSRQCPSASSAVKRRSTSRSCPTMTRLTSKRACSSSGPAETVSTDLGRLVTVSDMSVTVRASRRDQRQTSALTARHHKFGISGNSGHRRSLRYQ
jgi:hypothetical protein